MNFQELYTLAKSELDSITKVEKSDIRLEQVSFNETDETWEVIISYLVENNNQTVNPLTALKGVPPFERIFKKVLIDSKKGVKGFFIYEHYPKKWSL